MNINGNTKSPDFLMSDNTLTITLNGDIDHHSAKSVRSKIDSEIFLIRPKHIVLDLSRVDFMDSSGLGLILGRYTKAGEIGCDLKLKNPNEKVRKILDLAGVERIIGMIESETEHQQVFNENNTEVQ